MSAHIDRRTVLANGGKHVNSTTPQTGGKWYGFLALQDTTITTITCPGISGAPLTNIALPAFAFFPLPEVSAFTLADGGDVIAVE